MSNEEVVYAIISILTNDTEQAIDKVEHYDDKEFIKVILLILVVLILKLGKKKKIVDEIIVMNPFLEHCLNCVAFENCDSFTKLFYENILNNFLCSSFPFIKLELWTTADNKRLNPQIMTTIFCDVKDLYMHSMNLSDGKKLWNIFRKFTARLFRDDDDIFRPLRDSNALLPTYNSKSHSCKDHSIASSGDHKRWFNKFKELKKSLKDIRTNLEPDDINLTENKTMAILDLGDTFHFLQVVQIMSLFLSFENKYLFPTKNTIYNNSVVYTFALINFFIITGSQHGFRNYFLHVKGHIVPSLKILLSNHSQSITVITDLLKELKENFELDKTSTNLTNGVPILEFLRTKEYSYLFFPEERSEDAKFEGFLRTNEDYTKNNVKSIHSKSTKPVSSVHFLQCTHCLPGTNACSPVYQNPLLQDQPGFSCDLCALFEVLKPLVRHLDDQRKDITYQFSNEHPSLFFQMKPNGKMTDQPIKYGKSDNVTVEMASGNLF